VLTLYVSSTPLTITMFGLILTDRDALVAADDATLLRLMSTDARKLAVLREAVRQWRAARPVGPPAPALPPYQQ
jgi:hypothetical protein